MSVFGKRLKELRTNRKLTQRELAKILDTDHSTISKWEKGVIGVPEWEMVKKISVVFNVPVPYLLGADQIDLKKALEEVEITWGGKKLTEEQKQMCRDILEAFLKRMIGNSGPSM